MSGTNISPTEVPSENTQLLQPTQSRLTVDMCNAFKPLVSTAKFWIRKKNAERTCLLNLFMWQLRHCRPALNSSIGNTDRCLTPRVTNYMGRMNM